MEQVNMEAGPLLSHDGIELNVMGDNKAASSTLSPAVARQMSSSGERHPVVDLHVGLPDFSHITLQIDKRIQATEVMDLVIENLQLNVLEARRLLSLWLASEDLELQLKPNHCPVQLFGKWPTYLKKYTTLSEKEANQQRPQLLLRRNVYISREEDLQATDLQILQLLFSEARGNVMEGDYPCGRDLAVKLAGILALLLHGPFDENKHTLEFYKANLAELIAPYLLARLKVHDLLCDVLHAHMDQSAKHKASIGKPSDQVIMTAYLTACCDLLAYYGCVFFVGHIERTQKGLMKNPKLPVTIAVNTDGIFLIDLETKDPILGILYEDLTWEFIKGEQDVEDVEHPKSPHGSSLKRLSLGSSKPKLLFPSLLLQYPVKDNGDKVIKLKVLRVFTKAAPMIDAFIENCNEMMRSRLQPSVAPSPMYPAAHSQWKFPVDAVEGDIDQVDSGPQLSLPAASSQQGHSRTYKKRVSLVLEKATRDLCKEDKLPCQSFNTDGTCCD